MKMAYNSVQRKQESKINKATTKQDHLIPTEGSSKSKKKRSSKLLNSNQKDQNGSFFFPAFVFAVSTLVFVFIYSVSDNSNLTAFSYNPLFLFLKKSLLSLSQD